MWDGIFMKAAIIGLGVVGGSIAHALKNSSQPFDLTGVDASPAARDEALLSGLFDRVLAEATGSPDVVFVCVPLNAVEPVFLSLSGLPEGTVVTDVTGIKSPVKTLAKTHLPHCHYIGAHPMAGGEKGGFEHARPDAFAGAVVAICAGDSPNPEALARVTDLWVTMGATPLLMTAEEHDEVIATTSHLPYLIALTLTEFSYSPNAPKLAGGSYRDTTLRADFAPEIMAPVLNQNSFLPATARRFAAHLLELADLVEKAPGEFTQRAAEVRDRRHP